MYLLKETKKGKELIYYQEKLDGISSETRERNYEYESAQRSKRDIIEYGLSNNWDYMVTITIDQAKRNRYEYNYLVRSITKWLKNYKERYDSELKYIIIPELHTKKHYETKPAIHFHGLIKMTDKHLTFVKERKGAFIYEHSKILKSFGFNEFAKIYNHSEFITYYISKYVSKSLGKKITSQRFYASKNLERPKKTYYNDTEIPLVLWSIAPDYENQFIKKWNVDKDILDLIPKKVDI